VHPLYKHELEHIEYFEKKNPSLKKPKNLLNWCIRIELDKFKLLLNSIELEDIIIQLYKLFPHIFIVFKPIENKDVILRIYLKSTITNKKRILKLKDLISIAENILNSNIRGISNVTNVRVVKTNKFYIDVDGSVKNHPMYYMISNGTNLNQLFTDPIYALKIKLYKSYSSSIKEIEYLFGVEAARKKLMIELQKIVPGLHYSHYIMFADEMSCTGYLTSISRTGLAKREKNPLLRSTYSFQGKVLTDSAIDAEQHKLYGVGASLLLGQIPSVGTNYNTIINNSDFIDSNSVSTEDLIELL
jgi:hypothetical protein